MAIFAKKKKSTQSRGQTMRSETIANEVSSGPQDEVRGSGVADATVTGKSSSESVPPLSNGVAPTTLALSGTPTVAESTPQTEMRASALVDVVVASGTEENALPMGWAVDDSTTDEIELDPELVEAESELRATPPPIPTFGLADAIRLMRSLPADANPDLVVRVVRLTMGAVDVTVQDIMEDAFRSERALRDRLTILNREALELEKNLIAKRHEIRTHETRLAETASVRERLRKAAVPGARRPPPPPATANRMAPQLTGWATEP